MRLSVLLEERSTLALEIGGETLNLVVRPGAYDDEFLERAGEMSVNDGLQKLVLSWDLEDEKGKPIPLTAEALRRVPLPVKRRIMRHIQEQLFPNAG